jgi:hypothetical protein
MIEAARVVTGLLADSEWEVIDSMTGGRRLSAAELNRAVMEYGRTLTTIPGGELEELEVIPVAATGGKSFQIFSKSYHEYVAAVPLWTKEEGLSDLTLELRIREDGDALYETQIDDLRVM